MDIFRHKQLTRLEGARRPQAHEDIARGPARRRAGRASAQHPHAVRAHAVRAQAVRAQAVRPRAAWAPACRPRRSLPRLPRPRGARVQVNLVLLTNAPQCQSRDAGDSGHRRAARRVLYVKK